MSCIVFGLYMILRTLGERPDDYTTDADVWLDNGYLKIEWWGDDDSVCRSADDIFPAFRNTH